MSATTATPPATTRPAGRAARRAGWVITGLVTAFLLVNGVTHLLRPPVAVETTAALGFSADSLLVMGTVQLTCLALYLVRPTSVLGAVLLTGYLGGAVTAHLRVGDPLLSHTLFPVYLGALVWIGLWLREPALRAMLPLRRG